MKRFFLILTAILLIFSCSRKDKVGETPKHRLGEIPEIRHIDMPTEVKKESNELKVSLLISHRFFQLEENQSNQKFVALIEKAQKNGEFLTFYFKEGTNKIVRVEEISEEDKKMLERASIPITKVNSNLQSIVPDEATLNKLFEEIKTQTCSFDKKYPCISFDYPEDGCYARAHKMKQFLAQKGYDCEKQFIYGNLRIRYDGITPERGGCCVNWSYHTSVLVSYRDERGKVQKKILDPSISKKGPLSVEEWEKACQNSSCGDVEITKSITVSSDIYARNINGDKVIYDPNYKNTDCVLQIFSRVFGCFLPVPSTVSCGF
ncbi:MAG: protein-glutamine glutaminase [Flavobacteriaceae bacterium]|nr:protein-glutamine glutaminase [Flavobacteriaceae bacterium]